MRLKSKALALPVDSSSPMVLVAESGNNRRSSSSPQVKSLKHCFNFAKGMCRFGDSCHFMHDANAHVGTSYSGVNKGLGNGENTTNELLTKLPNQLGNLGLHATISNPPTNATPLVGFLASPSPTPSPPAGPTHLYPPGFAPMAHDTPSYYTSRPPSAPTQHVKIIPAQQFGVYLGKRKSRKGQNQIKTRQKREAWRSREKSKTVTVNKERKTEENAKRRAKSAKSYKLYKRKKKKMD
nr:hybrid signal transduction histidine kinase M [Tanacetum cinerariifolium]